MRAWAAAAMMASLASSALAQTPASPPDAATILFETPQFANAPPGTVLAYRYKRSSPLAEQLFGPAIEDRILLTVEAGADTSSRNVRVEMFTGERRRPAGPFENTSANPVLLLFLEHNLESLARVVGANPRYLKNAIRAGLRDHATATRMTAQAGGHAEPGWAIEVQPFVDDPQKERMKGLHTLRFRFETADAVPGQIVCITAEANAPDGKLLQESLTYESSAR